MKNKKILLFSLLFIFFILVFSNTCMAKELDVIHDYIITVEPRTDGTLDMKYHIKWEVLDSTTEGPLSWVKIGIPNANINGIASKSKNVSSIRYLDDGTGDYLRIDFNKDYEKGDIFTFDFSFHVTHMYDLNNTYCKYKFTPGWFNDISVKNLTILWKAKNVSESDSKKKNSDNYLEWETSLIKGQKYTVNVTYPIETFKIDYDKQASNYEYVGYSSSNNSEFIDGMGTIVVLLFAVIFIGSILSMFSGVGYYNHSGYYGSRYGYRHHHHRPYHSRSSFGSTPRRSSCVSSCACACACAGGGRAGCSKKDFYGKNLRTAKLNKILKDNKKI